jgi:hypothetical protein
MIRKIGFYFLSLWLLFISVIILTIKIPICCETDWVYVGTWNLISINIIPIICIISLIIGAISYYDFQYTLQGTEELAFKITDIENINYEPLTFLSTYIIPLVCIDLENIRYLIILLILLIVIGIIYVKTDLFYANPTLAIFKFKLYKVTGNFRYTNEIRTNIILITKDRLTNNDKVKYIKLDDRIYYAKKIGI